jgi:glycosyltransferase involved in cell wall biosynthesis
MIHYMTPQGLGGAWIANEIEVIERAGIPFRIHALNPPKEGFFFFSPEKTAAMNRDTNTLYPLPVAAAARAVLAAPFRFGARFWSALGNALTGRRETLRIRLVGLWHFAVACHWAGQLARQEVSHIHAQWIHSSGTVAMYGAWLLDRSFSFTGHAADLFRDRCALHDKIARADFIICISEFHRSFYLEHGARPDQLRIAYCGIDTDRFSPARRARPEGAPVHILSSGRLVPKKGFAVLIEACRILRERGVAFRCTIAGSGPDGPALGRQIVEAGLEGDVTLTGETLDQETVPEFMHGGDIYALACRWAPDKDVDGLPMMLMEAMACGLPTVSTRLVGIPDLIRDGETGLLVASDDAESLAEALARLARDDALAARLSGAGRRHLEETFDLRTCLEPLIGAFRERLGTP